MFKNFNELKKNKAFCQWKDFFSQASDDLEKEAHPSEEAKRYF